MQVHLPRAAQTLLPPQAAAVGGNSTTLGTANAQASATTINGLSQADAFAIGSSGTAKSHIQAAFGTITALTADGSAPASNGGGHSESYGSVGQVAPSPSNAANVQAAVFTTGNAIASDSLDALATNPTVHQNFNVNGEGTGPVSQILALVALGSTHASAAGSQSYTAAASESIDLGQLPSSQHLLIGFLAPNVSGGGFDSLHSG